jgi:cytochrome c5
LEKVLLFLKGMVISMIVPFTESLPAGYQKMSLDFVSYVFLMMMTIKPLLLFIVCSILLLASCSSGDVSPNKEEVTESKKEAAEEQMLAEGKAIYESNCAGCHNANVAGAPTPGDKADWTDRMAQGIKVMAKKSIEGFEGKKGVMQPKGGNSTLTDHEVTNAVYYMVQISQ